MRFSIITVCFNAGSKLNKTVQSILNQTYLDYEIIVKDGKSTDGCVDNLLQNTEVTAEVANGKIRIIVDSDDGVYDGMNQALPLIKGDYVIFMNCGDCFADENVLLRTSAYIESYREKESFDILYGDIYCENRKVIDAAPTKLDRFQCYRNIPCHQACFYKNHLFHEKKYDTTLKVRADYDHFLWCILEKKATTAYLGFTVASYEGNGISEDVRNEQLEKAEHNLVVHRYMTEKEIRRYKRIMVMTLLPLRKKVADNPRLSGFYHKMKDKVYRRS